MSAIIMSMEKSFIILQYSIKKKKGQIWVNSDIVIDQKQQTKWNVGYNIID